MPLEKVVEGQVVNRNEVGKFAPGGTLSPERAAEMGKHRWSGARADSVSELLREAGYPNPADCPQHLRLLADLGCGKTAGSVPALRAFLQLTGRWVQEPEEITEGLTTAHFIDKNDDIIASINGSLYIKMGLGMVEELILILEEEQIDAKSSARSPKRAKNHE